MNTLPHLAHLVHYALDMLLVYTRHARFRVGEHGLEVGPLAFFHLMLCSGNHLGLSSRCWLCHHNKQSRDMSGRHLRALISDMLQSL